MHDSPISSIDWRLNPLRLDVSRDWSLVSIQFWSFQMLGKLPLDCVLHLLWSCGLFGMPQNVKQFWNKVLVEVDIFQLAQRIWSHYKNANNNNPLTIPVVPLLNWNCHPHDFLKLNSNAGILKDNLRWLGLLYLKSSLSFNLHKNQVP